jgi:Flp pilus assembly protein TadB
VYEVHTNCAHTHALAAVCARSESLALVAVTATVVCVIVICLCCAVYKPRPSKRRSKKVAQPMLMLPEAVAIMAGSSSGPGIKNLVSLSLTHYEILLYTKYNLCCIDSRLLH